MEERDEERLASAFTDTTMVLYEERDQGSAG
jgi:hypothetical protein